MCGIVGVASDAPMAPSGLAEHMRDTMIHRGPDDAGIWWAEDRRVWLAQRRLAVVDLSPGGHQPMADRSGHLQLVFNGEIYNHQALRADLEARGHRFRSSCDTEVLLEAYSEWGLDCLTRLNGMFAFALYDARRRVVFLARDRAGEKPLFYRHDGNRLWFASELKALLADPRSPRCVDLTALSHYLCYGYVPGDGCILKGFRKLRQAEAMTYDVADNQLIRWNYWELPPPSGQYVDGGPDLDAQLEALLRESVRIRLEADVPVGVLLSGGIDSSLITALAAGVSSQPVRTFTIAFPGHGSFDEGPHARIVADHFGTDHTELVAEPASLDLLPEMACQFDEPMADSSMIPTYLLSRLIRGQATVAIGGDGGDELFGGYPHYSSLMNLESLRRVIPRPARRIAGALASSMPPGLRGRNYLLGLSADRQASPAYTNVYFDAATRCRLVPALARNPEVLNAPERFKRTLVGPGQPSASRALAVDFMTYLVDDILVKVDRSSMLASLEVRSPWLDPAMIDFAFARVPMADKVTRTHQKVLSRRLAGRVLPDTVDLNRKQGLSLPLEAWFRGEWGIYVESVLLDDQNSPFDRHEVKRLIDLQRRGYHNTQRLFALMMFELWQRHYRIEVPG